MYKQKDFFFGKISTNSQLSFERAMEFFRRGVNLAIEGKNDAYCYFKEAIANASIGVEVGTRHSISLSKKQAESVEFYLGNVEFSLFHRDYVGAIKEANKILQIDPSNCRALATKKLVFEFVKEKQFQLQDDDQISFILGMQKKS